MKLVMDGAGPATWIAVGTIIGAVITAAGAVAVNLIKVRQVIRTDALTHWQLISAKAEAKVELLEAKVLLMQKEHIECIVETEHLKRRIKELEDSVELLKKIANVKEIVAKEAK